MEARGWWEEQGGTGLETGGTGQRKRRVMRIDSSDSGEEGAVEHSKKQKADNSSRNVTLYDVETVKQLGSGEWDPG